MISIILAEDHRLVRSAIKSLLLDEPSIKILAEAADGLEACEVTEKLRPDLLLLDLSMPRLHGLAVISRVVAATKTRVLVLTMHSDGLNVQASLAAGALGYILKDASPEELIQGINAVMRDDPFISPRLRRTMVETVIKPKQSDANLCASLTPRERVILQHTAAGLSSADIGKALFVSPRTVESHRSNLMKKLRLSNQTEVVRFAIRHSIMQP